MPTSTDKLTSRAAYWWLQYVMDVSLLLLAIVAAFPRVVGLDNDPNYFVAVALLCFGVGCGSIDFETRTSKKRQIILAAMKYAAGNTTLEEYGSRTKEILNDK